MSRKLFQFQNYLVLGNISSVIQGISSIAGKDNQKGFIWSFLAFLYAMFIALKYFTRLFNQPLFRFIQSVPKQHVNIKGNNEIKSKLTFVASITIKYFLISLTLNNFYINILDSGSFFCFFPLVSSFVACVQTVLKVLLRHRLQFGRLKTDTVFYYKTNLNWTEMSVISKRRYANKFNCYRSEANLSKRS